MGHIIYLLLIFWGLGVCSHASTIKFNNFNNVQQAYKRQWSIKEESKESNYPLKGNKFVPNSQADKDIYRFAVTGDTWPFAFESKTGGLVGFDVDIIDTVCKKAGKECFTVLVDAKACVFTDRQVDYAGRGLRSRWFDGCPHSQVTVDRQEHFHYTLPYVQGVSNFAVAQGNPLRFDPTIEDYRNFRFVRVNGEPTNEVCLTRLSKRAESFLVVNTAREAVDAVRSGQADVFFTTSLKVPDLDILESSGDVKCDDGGTAILESFGSDLITWWDPVFTEIFHSDEYESICKEASKKYGIEIPCITTNDKLGKQISLFKPKQTEDTKLWKFVVSGHVPPYSFLDKDGHLVGWTKLFVEEVCRLANKKCTLTLAVTTECTFRENGFNYIGEGLQSNWFDACTGYYDTEERLNSFDFTAPYLFTDASFFVRPGNPTGFNPDSNDYSNFTIAYTSTTMTNSHCLNRLKKKVGNVLVTHGLKHAELAVLHGKADVMFNKRGDEEQLERLPQRVHCERGGTCLMVPKGSDLPSWWDEGFRKFQEGGRFLEFCEQQSKLYDFEFPCIKTKRSSASHPEEEGF